MIIHALGKEEVHEIVQVMLKEIIKRCKLQMELNVKTDELFVELIVQKGFDEKYGARPLRRTIQTMVEDRMAEAILES